MKTIELMSSEPRSVRAIDRLDAAAKAMWEGDCGLVPVVDSDHTLVGVVTDRDLCMASYTKGRALAEIPVVAAMAQDVVACRADEPVADVMRKMQELRVHRLPVVSAAGALIGIISSNDLVRAAHARPAAVDPVAVVRLLATIGAPRQPAPAALPTEAAPASASASAVETAASATPRKAAAKTTKKTTKKAGARKAAAKNSATKSASTRSTRAAAKPTRRTKKN